MSHPDAYLDRYVEADKPWADRDEAHWPVPYWHIDTGMAVLLMLLTAVDAGLDACLAGVARELIAPWRDAFGVPGTYLPIGAVAIGYRSAKTPAQPTAWAGRRRTATSVIHHSRWSAAG
jgi:nitroreductase